MLFIGQIINWILWIFLLILFARMILSWVPVLVRDWEPRGPMLVVAEIIYSITDPPLRLLRKVLKPVPVGSMMLDLAFIGLAALSGYKVSYDVSRYMPASAPSNVGYAAAERHFSKARLNPELLMIETDHDLRNPTDMILLERVAKAVFHTDGIAQVQSITRPLGTPLDNTSIPFQISATSAAQINNLPYQQARAADLQKQVGVINDSINVLRQQYALQQQSSDITHEQSQAFQDTVATTQELRDKIANFDDFFRPLRNYFYWEPHCYNIPICWSMRSIFDTLDGRIARLTKTTTEIGIQLDADVKRIVIALGKALYKPAVAHPKLHDDSGE